MKNLRSEYKLLIVLGVVFLVILIIVLFKENYFGKLVDSYNEKKLINCTETKRSKGISYTEYFCTVSDQTGNSYQLSYIQIDTKNDAIKKLNKTLKNNYDNAYKNVEYIKENDKIKLETYESIEYKIYYYNGITSLLIKKGNIKNNIVNKVDEYTIYNIDVLNDSLLNDDDMKDKLNITRDLSSRLRSVVVEMYATQFRYNYYGEYGIYKNKNIDDSVEGVTYNSINNIYIDDDGNTNFILYLYNPNRGEGVPYHFKVDKNNKITYNE